MSKVFKITGMDCDACAKMIELDLEDVGIDAKCSYAEQKLEVISDDKKLHQKAVAVVKNSGYGVA